MKNIQKEVERRKKKNLIKKLRKDKLRKDKAKEIKKLYIALSIKRETHLKFKEYCKENCYVLSRKLGQIICKYLENEKQRQ